MPGSVIYWVTRRPQNEIPAQRFDRRVADLRRYGIIAAALNNYHSDLPLLLERVDVGVRQIRRLRAVFVAGSVADADPEGERIGRLVSSLAKHLISAGLAVVTGLGHGMGNETTTAALDEMRRLSNRTRPDQLIVRPFPADARDGDARRTTHRREMLEHAGFAVFIRGRGDADRRHGMWEEYFILRELGGWPIPLGATGKHAAAIWSEVWANFDSIFGACRRVEEVRDVFPHLNDQMLSDSDLVAATLRVIELLQI